MVLETLTDFVPLKDAGNASQLFADTQEIRILIYTDEQAVKDENDETSAFGLGLLKKFMTAQQSELGKPIITVVNRNGNSCQPDQHASKKLTELLPQGGGGFDQVWFFGFHMANLTEIVCGSTPSFAEKGGPESELTVDEVTRLLDWMRTGGVLVTGDHSSARSKKAVDTSLPQILSLGRALGHLVPRAGQLRTWEGGPTTDIRVSHNTQEPSCGLDLNDDQVLQSDRQPQRFIPLRLNPQGQPDASGIAHFLFRTRGGCVINVFPDHVHEGDVLDPGNISGGDLPPNAAAPFVVAVSTDKRIGKTYNMVAVYDGSGGATPTGRIVVDSTWHHYFNMNLTGFAGDLSNGSVADLLGQYYYNLAVWLSSREKLREMARAMFWWLANHPVIAEEGAGPAMRLGAIAWRLLARVASPGLVNELLLAYTSEEIRAELPAMYYPEHGFLLDPFPSQELILGSVVNQYLKQMARSAAGSEHADAAADRAAIDRVITTGFKNALKEQADTLRAVRAQAREFRQKFI